jgi:potassium efflux system protein
MIHFKRLSYTIALLISLLTVNSLLMAQKITISKDSASSVPDTLLFKIQKAQSSIMEINSANKRGFDIDGYRKSLQGIKNNLIPLQQDLKMPDKNIDNKSLQSYNLIIKDAQLKLANLSTALSKQNGDLQRMSDDVVRISNDSVLKVNLTDTAEKKFYVGQLTEIRERLQEAGKSTTAHLDTTSRLLADVSSTLLEVSNLQDQVNDHLVKSGKNSFKRESPYLWSAPKTNTLGSSFGEILKSSYQGQNKILTYFFNSTWDNRILVLLIGLAFFIWVYKNYKLALKPDLRQKLGELKFDYLGPYPFLATIIVALNLTPIFELDSPSLYIELIQFLLLGAITIHFWRILNKKELKYWLAMVLLYMLLILTNTMVTEAAFSRLLLILLNVIFILMGRRIYRELKNKSFVDRQIKPVLTMYFAFHILSILLNVFGRISLAKVLSITAVIGLTQVIGLAIFVQVLTQSLELQIKVSSCSEGIFSRIDVNKTRAAFKRLLNFLAGALWVLVFTINLSLTSGIFTLFGNILNKTRTFGSISFTLTNILFFLIIVYISNNLQKHVGILFGEKSLSFEDQTEHKSSKVALIRLIIIIIGVLMAITASGIPMDRLTVVLGALSVGIGLGMQNIVNNFVSGIILIFEKPFRIGDFVELADKKGKVQDIGIRASKMLTPQGSEVIIPNGDLLSGRLVNWTLSNDYLKAEITFKVSAEADIDVISKIIEDEISKAESSLKNMTPEILINGIAADSVEIKVIAWITNIYNEASFKSQIYKELILKFKEKGIKIM